MIYLLNIKLNLYHNDLHFNNIIFVEEEQTINYNFNDIKFTNKNNYTLRVYDYDYSYYESLGNNPMIIDELCLEIYGVCNKKTNKDLWTLIVSTILLLKNDTLNTTTKGVLKKIIKILTNNMNDTELDIIIDIILNIDGIHKHRLCDIDIIKKIYTETCGNDIKSLKIEEIINLYYNTFIISDVKRTQQKYLKYKTKYYMMKKLF